MKIKTKTILWSCATNPGKSSEILKQYHVKSWLTYRNNNCLTLSCKPPLKLIHETYLKIRINVFRNNVFWLRLVLAIHDVHLKLSIVLFEQKAKLDGFVYARLQVFQKVTGIKKEKNHIKCDRCRILEIYDGCLKTFPLFYIKKSYFPSFSYLRYTMGWMDYIKKKLTLCATHRWPQYCQRSYGPCPPGGLQAWVFHDPLYPWTRAYTGCIGNNVRGHWPITSSSHVYPKSRIHEN